MARLSDAHAELWSALRFAGIVILTLALLAIFGCTPSAEGREPRLEADSTVAIEKETRRPTAFVMAAAGDSVKAQFFFTTSNAPDSIACTFSGAGATPLRVVVPGSARNCGPVYLVPVPALAPGDSALMATNWTLYKKNAPNVSGGPYTRYFKRPVLPPSLTPDSLNLSQAKILADPLKATNPVASVINGTLRFCGAMVFKDGKIGLRSTERADTVCTRYYATSVGYAQRVNPVAYVGGKWQAAPASPARQAVLDGVCFMADSLGVRVSDTTTACRTQLGALRSSWLRYMPS